MSSSWTITDPESPLDLVDEARAAPMHPGRVLAYEFMEPLKLDVSAVSKGVGRPVEAIEGLLAGTVDIDADLALRLGHAFSVEPRFWMSLQSQYRLDLARRDSADIDQLPVLHRAAA